MDVTLYSTHCPKCGVIESVLKKKHIEYVENNDIEEMIKLGFETVPMLKVNEKVLNYTEALNYLMEEDKFEEQ